MKNKFFVFLFLLAIIGFCVNRFGLYDKYFSRKDQNSLNDTSVIKKVDPNDQKNKIIRKIRPKRTDPYVRVDQYAFNTPKSKSQTIQTLAAYLSQKGTTDYEKARMAYAWIAKNVGYDDIGYNTGQYGNLSAEGVFQSKRAVCEGYSNLYKALCDSMGLECIKNSGYAKGYSYKPGEKFTKTNHAWNAVKIDGQWKLVDATWGAGYGTTVNGKLKSIKQYTSYWFAVDPYEFLFKHLPEKREDQFISNSISKEQYEAMSDVDHDLFELGISGKTIFNNACKNSSYQPPNAWMPDYYISLVEADMNRSLKASENYTFQIRCPEDVDIALVNEKDWHHLKQSEGIYATTISPKEGKLTLSVRLNGFETNYKTVLRYQVK